MFFDGASKFNPGVAGGGGVIYNLEENIEIYYSYSIVFATNNKVEAYGLWQGLKQLENLGMDEAMVFGDSRIIIQAMNVPSQLNNLNLYSLLR